MHTFVVIAEPACNPTNLSSVYEVMGETVLHMHVQQLAHSYSQPWHDGVPGKPVDSLLRYIEITQIAIGGLTAGQPLT